MCCFIVHRTLSVYAWPVTLETCRCLDTCNISWCVYQTWTIFSTQADLVQARCCILIVMDADWYSSWCVCVRRLEAMPCVCDGYSHSSHALLPSSSGYLYIIPEHRWTMPRARSHGCTLIRRLCQLSCVTGWSIDNQELPLFGSSMKRLQSVAGNISCVYTRANIVRAKYIPGYFSSDYIRVASTLHYAITLRTLAALTWH